MPLVIFIILIVLLLGGGGIGYVGGYDGVGHGGVGIGGLLLLILIIWLVMSSRNFVNAVPLFYRCDMSKKKKDPKKKSKPQEHEDHPELKLPVHPDCPVTPLPEKVTVVPVHIEPEKIVPLAKATPLIECVLMPCDGISSLWGGRYIVLMATEGHTLPDVPDGGMLVGVQFSPPAFSAPPMPHD